MTRAVRLSDAEIARFLVDLQQVVNGQLMTAFVAGQVQERTPGTPSARPRQQIRFRRGRRYGRLERIDPAGTVHVYGFLDLGNGCILYPRDAQSPDPIPRGSLLRDAGDPSLGRAALGPEMVRRLDDPALDPTVLAALRTRFAPQTRNTAKLPLVVSPSSGSSRPSGQLRTLTFPVVWHVGVYPDPPPAQRWVSQEGIGLSVSRHPQDWIAIAKLGGLPIRTLARRDGAPGRFLDGHAAKRVARDWGVAQSLVRSVPAWRVSWYDDEVEDEVGMEFLDQAEARLEAEERQAETEDGAPAIRPVRRLVAVGALAARLATQYGQSFAAKLDPVIESELLNRFVAARHPELDGVWWKDAYDPAALSAPRGLILPERLPDWQVVG
jgi:hypothetical protein